MIASRNLSWLFLVIYLAAMSALGFMQREQFALLSILFLVSTVAYMVPLYGLKNVPIKPALALVLIVRLPFLFELPLLSDDFYRFLWDGMMLNEGFNSLGNIPMKVPIEQFKNQALAKELFEKMNSPQYPSIYPPYHQAIFGLMYFLSGGSIAQGVLSLRLIILAFELLLVLYMYRGARSLLPFGLMYLLNPLVVLEGFGNLHFEAIWVPILGVAFIELHRRKAIGSAIGWTSAVLMKFVPLITGPIVLFQLLKKGLWKFAAVSLGLLTITALMWLPGDTLSAFTNGLGIYYGIFEFNASVYYIAQQIGTAILGYNPIQVVSPILGALIAVKITWISFRYRQANLFELVLVAFLIFLVLSPTVHPWYVIPVVFFALLSRRFAVLAWAGLVVLSYSHYVGVIGPKWGYIAVEYTGLLVALLIEQKKKPWLQSAFRG